MREKPWARTLTLSSPPRDRNTDGGDTIMAHAKAQGIRLVTLLGIALTLTGCGSSVDPRLGPRVEALRAYRTDPNPDHEAVRAMVEIGAPAVPALVDLLRDEERFIRRGAAYALGGIGPDAKGALPAIVDTLSDGAQGNWVVRQACVYALVHIGLEADVMLPTMYALLDDNSLTVRGAAVDVLLPFGTRIVPDFVEILVSNDRDAARMAQSALRRIGEPAVPALSQLLHSEHEGTRNRAVGLLLGIGSPEAIHAIDHMYDERPPSP